MTALGDAAEELRRRGLDVALDEERNLLIAKDPKADAAAGAKGERRSVFRRGRAKR